MKIKLIAFCLSIVMLMSVAFACAPQQTEAPVAVHGDLARQLVQPVPALLDHAVRGRDEPKAVRIEIRLERGEYGEEFDGKDLLSSNE